jgi:NAD(P)-dependent dehydrogenase (short-subunit alcohol dehydrogenase family)
MSGPHFEGKIAVVTGGNSGIGLGVAKAYAREGAQVAITGRNAGTLDAAAKEIGGGTLAIRSDASKLPDIEAAMKQVGERFGRIDALFVNAGIARFVPFQEVTEAFFDETVNVNLKGVFFTVQKAVPLMPRGSAVVLNASINAHLGMPGTTVYGATKAAVANLAKTLSADLLDKGIRVNAISPGPITSSLLDRDGVAGEKLRQTKDWIQSQVPIKRFGTPEEIAAAVLYLSSADSAFVVGSELLIDGGMATL